MIFLLVPLGVAAEVDKGVGDDVGRTVGVTIKVGVGVGDRVGRTVGETIKADVAVEVGCTVGYATTLSCDKSAPTLP